jgi:hypothetical protein
VAPGNYTIIAYMHSTVSFAFTAWVTTANVTVNSTNSNASMYIDTPAPNTTRLRPFTISGWAVDSGATTGTGIDAVHVWAFPVGGAPQFPVGAAATGLSRPDVGAYLGDSRFNSSGFSLTLSSANVPSPGTYDFYVFGRSTVTGTFNIWRIVRVTVQ